MKPKEPKPEVVFRIIDRTTEQAVGSYSHACCDEYDFESVHDAREANCHGMFKDNGKYKIAKYKVTYELIEDDVPGFTNPVETNPVIIDFIKALEEEFDRENHLFNPHEVN